MQALIERYGEPNEYDQCPYGTLCRVRTGEKYDIYRQVSKNQQKPLWSLVEFPDIGMAFEEIEEIKKRIPL